jgi:hypothetical protein
VNGYTDPVYADSLAGIGSVRWLTSSGGFLLERNIPGTRDVDLMGAYPLFTCCNWQALAVDLEALPEHLVSVALVTDPFGAYDRNLLLRTFPHHCLEYKDHFVADLKLPYHQNVNAHHRYYARRALTQVQVDIAGNPATYLDEWCGLYQDMIDRWQLSGIHAFSRNSFDRLMQLPGLVMFRAINGDQAIASMLWVVQDSVAYSHLSATSTLGYQLRASYALHAFAMEYFRTRVEWLDFGGGVGLNPSPTDGLVIFKKGWASSVRKVYFCGRILNPERYQRLLLEKGNLPTNYFPAYRQGEFGA